MKRVCLDCGAIAEATVIRAHGGRCPRCSGNRERERSRVRRQGVDAIYSTSAWQTLRREVLDGADRCGWCGRSGVRLVAGHIRSVREAPHLALEPSNVAPICRSCNERTKRRPQPTQPRYPGGGV